MLLPSKLGQIKSFFSSAVLFESIENLITAANDGSIKV